MTSATRSAEPDAAVIDGVNVDAVAAAVLACVGVAGLDSGQFGEVASYLPGRTVAGIVVSGGRVTVQIRARWAVPAPRLGAVIRSAVTPLAPTRPVDVVIADIDDPPRAPEPGTACGGTGLAARPTI